MTFSKRPRCLLPSCRVCWTDFPKPILEDKVTDHEQFCASAVKPKEHEDDKSVKEAFRKIFEQDKVTFHVRPKLAIPTISDMLGELEALWKENMGKPHYINAIVEVHLATL